MLYLLSTLIENLGDIALRVFPKPLSVMVPGPLRNALLTSAVTQNQLGDFLGE
jgi:hypothetical protein